MTHLAALRRALPLGGRLMQLAPGASRGLSDLAAGVPGRGRGGGGASQREEAPAPGSAGRAEPAEAASSAAKFEQEASSTDSRYTDHQQPSSSMDAAEPSDRSIAPPPQQLQQESGDGRGGDEGGHSRRRRGRMSSLLASEREGQDGVAAGAQQGRPRRAGERRMYDGGREDPDIDLNRPITLPLPDQDPEGKPVVVPAADLVTIEELGVDPSRLWLLKYVLGPETLARLQEGALGGEALEEVAAKVASTLTLTEHEKDMKVRHHMQMNWDPHYRLTDGLGFTPRTDGKGGKASRKLPRAHEILDPFKEELLETLDMDEDLFEEAKAEAELELEIMRDAVHIALPKDDEDRLRRLVDKAVPPEHPQYKAVREKIDVVAANAHWPTPRKLKFAKELLKGMGCVRGAAV